MYSMSGIQTEQKTSIYATNILMVSYSLRSIFFRTHFTTKSNKLVVFGNLTTVYEWFIQTS